ncbi:MAG: hypothetical protein ACI9MF_001826, partial [Gammaproteobacteria bacterium]
LDNLISTISAAPSVYFYSDPNLFSHPNLKGKGASINQCL